MLLLAARHCLNLHVGQVAEHDTAVVGRRELGKAWIGVASW